MVFWGDDGGRWREALSNFCFWLGQRGKKVKSTFFWGGVSEGLWVLVGNHLLEIKEKGVYFAIAEGRGKGRQQRTNDNVCVCCTILPLLSQFEPLLIYFGGALLLWVPCMLLHLPIKWFVWVEIGNNTKNDRSGVFFLTNLVHIGCKYDSKNILPQYYST